MSSINSSRCISSTCQHVVGGVCFSAVTAVAIGILYYISLNPIELGVSASLIGTGYLIGLYLIYHNNRQSDFPRIHVPQTESKAKAQVVQEISEVTHQSPPSTPVDSKEGVISKSSNSVCSNDSKEPGLEPRGPRSHETATSESSSQSSLRVNTSSSPTVEDTRFVEADRLIGEIRSRSAANFYEELFAEIHTHRDEPIYHAFIERAFSLHGNHLFRIMGSAAWTDKLKSDQKFRLLIGSLIPATARLNKIVVVETLYFDIFLRNIPEKHLSLEVLKYRDALNIAHIRASHDPKERKSCVSDLTQEGYNQLIYEVSSFSDDLYDTSKFFALLNNTGFTPERKANITRNMTIKTYNCYLTDVCNNFTRHSIAITKVSILFHRNKLLNFIKEAPESLTFEILKIFVSFVEFRPWNNDLPVDHAKDLIVEQAGIYNTFFLLRKGTVPDAYNYPAQWAKYYLANIATLQPEEAKGRFVGADRKKQIVMDDLGIPKGPCRDAFVKEYRSQKKPVRK